MEISGLLLTIVISRTGFFGSRSWVTRLRAGRTARGVLVLPIGLGVGRGREKISRRTALFSNGMEESEQRYVTLRINASEEAALMDLLNFMYSNTLLATTVPALLDVLMAADKFEVASCMQYCSRLLRHMPMTPESALLYLELPSSVLMGEAVQPLTDAARQFLASHYKDMTKFQEEVMALPLAGVETILSSDDLQIASEDTVYDFVLKWARDQYPGVEERREVSSQAFHLGGQGFFPLCSLQRGPAELFPLFWVVLGNAGKGVSEFLLWITSLRQGQSQLKSLLANIEATTHSQEARQLDTATYLPYHGHPSWRRIVSTSSKVSTTSGLSLPSGTDSCTVSPSLLSGLQLRLPIDLKLLVSLTSPVSLMTGN